MKQLIFKFTDRSIDNLKSSTSISQSDSGEDEKDKEITLSIPQKLSISEQKQALEALKGELLENKGTVESTQEDKVQTLPKDKKPNIKQRKLNN